MVLALLFMATPLLRVSGVTNRAGFNRQFNGQANPGGQNGFPFPGNGTQVPGNPTFPTDPNNPTTRQFPNRTQGLIGFGLLSGITGTIVYAIALLVSLAAAVGMFITKRWGQILGILMGVIYLLLAVVSFLPLILTAFTRGLNPLSLGLNILHLILAVAVIVLRRRSWPQPHRLRRFRRLLRRLPAHNFRRPACVVPDPG
jgi:Predicted membrane protein (DUF2127).